MEQIESRLNDVSIIGNDTQTIETKWGWPLKDLYRNALSFYKGKKKIFRETIWQRKYH